MAFPFLFEEDFELGSGGLFNSETDTQAKLNVRHYSWLARNLNLPDAMPFRGAYAMHIDLSLGTADAFLQEDDGFDLAADGESFVRIYVYVGSNLTMAASDRFTIFAMQSAGPVDEITIGIRNNAGVYEFVAAETGAASTLRAAPIVFNAWHCLELGVVLDAGGGNDGVITFFVDGHQVGATIATLDQAAITQARLGAIGIDAGTTAGHLLFDGIMADDTRIGPGLHRYANPMMLTKTGHAFVGPGKIESVTLMAGAATDNVLIVTDTDEANTVASFSTLTEVKSANAASESVTYAFGASEGYVQRGVYIQLTGTNPRALVTMQDALLSPGQIRSYALKRSAHGPF